MATFFPCSLRPPNSSLHSSHHVFTKVTWEWHGMTSSSSPFSSYHRTNSVTAHRQHLCICAPLVSGWLIKSPQSDPTNMVALGYTAGCEDQICDQVAPRAPQSPNVQNRTPNCNWRPNCAKLSNEGHDGTQTPWVHHHQGSPWVHNQIHGSDQASVGPPWPHNPNRGTRS